MYCCWIGGNKKLSMHLLFKLCVGTEVGREMMGLVPATITKPPWVNMAKTAVNLIKVVIRSDRYSD